MNMFLVKNVLDLPIQDMQVMLFDKHPDTSFKELAQKAFSPNHPVIRHQHYARKKVSGDLLFRFSSRLIL